MSFVVLAVLPQLLEAKDHVGHNSCRSKLVQNLVLTFYQNLTNFQRNLFEFSKTTKLLSLALSTNLIGSLWGPYDLTYGDMYLFTGEISFRYIEYSSPQMSVHSKISRYSSDRTYVRGMYWILLSRKIAGNKYP